MIQVIILMLLALVLMTTYLLLNREEEMDTAYYELWAEELTEDYERLESLSEGSNAVSLESLIKMARVFNCNLDTLIRFRNRLLEQEK